MLRSLVRFGFENRWAIVLGWLVLALAGLRAFVAIPIEPFPDPDDVHVSVVTQYAGKAPEEIETTVTRPLERAINGVPGLTRMRSVSMFGLSVITTTFDDETQDYFAREQVFERISQVALPSGVIPSMGPFSDSTGEVQTAIETGVGGAVATTLVESDRKFDVAVRLERDARRTPERIRRILVPAPDGSLVPVGEVADVRIQSGAAQIKREANSRRIAIKCGIRNRDLGSFIRDAMAKVDREVVKKTGPDGKLVRWKAGYRITWEGQFENQQRAMQRLGLIIPMCGVLIFALLFWTFGSLKTSALIMTTVPLALVGGVFGLWYMGIYLSVSAAIGFITLCGVAVENGIILVSRIHTLRDRERVPLERAILRGSADRLRAVLMTALTAALGFLPSVVSTGMGAEVRKPLAVVVLFGILGATIFTLIVLPLLYRIFEQGPVKAPGLAAH